MSSSVCLEAHLKSLSFLANGTCALMGIELKESVLQNSEALSSRGKLVSLKLSQTLTPFIYTLFTEGDMWEP